MTDKPRLVSSVLLACAAASLGACATFRVQAPRAYRRDRARWRVAIHMRHRSGSSVTIVRPAPAPDI